MKFVTVDWYKYLRAKFSPFIDNIDDVTERKIVAGMMVDMLNDEYHITPKFNKNFSDVISFKFPDFTVNSKKIVTTKKIEKAIESFKADYINDKVEINFLTSKYVYDRI